MPIAHTWDGEESVSVTYIDQGGTHHELPELLGDFEDALDAELSAIDHASGLMDQEERKELIRKAYARDVMRERGRKRWEGVTEEEKKAHMKRMSELGNKAQGKITKNSITNNKVN